MAKVTIEFDSDDCSLECKVNGKAIADVEYVQIYKKLGMGSSDNYDEADASEDDDDDDEYCMCISTCTDDESSESGLREYKRLEASIARDNLTITTKSKLHQDIAKFIRGF